MSDFQWRTFRTRTRQVLKLQTPFAIVGDEYGNIFDATIPGNVFVRVQYANGYGTPISVRGPVGRSVQLKPGTRVKLVLDDGRLTIDNYDVPGGAIGGFNVLAPNLPPPPTGNFIGQQSILTALVVPQHIPDLTVAILSWPVVVNGTYYVFSGKSVEDLSSYVPATGENCYVLVALNSDFATTTVTASTARGVDDLLLDAADVQECLTAAPSDCIPLAIIRLYGDQTAIRNADIILDMRQFINTASASGPTLPLSVANGGTGGNFSAVDGFLRFVSGASYFYKWNFVASAAPGVTDDASAGYQIGSVWIDITHDKIYGCTDNAVGAAVWKDMTGSGSGDARARVYAWIGL